MHENDLYIVVPSDLDLLPLNLLPQLLVSMVISPLNSSIEKRTDGQASAALCAAPREAT